MSDENVAVDQEDSVAETKEDPSEEEQAMAKLKEAISVEQAEIGPLRLKLTVTIPKDTLDERRSEEFAELQQDAMIPGFRKGHAPLRLVEKRFSSDVGKQLKSQLVTKGYLAAVEKEDLKPLGDPLFWVKVKEERPAEDGKTRTVETEKLLPIDQAIDNITMPREGPLAFSCEVELKPEFELPELKKIPVKRPKVSIEDDDVETELRRLRTMRGTFDPVEKGTVEPDDLLYADMKITVDGQLIVEEENFDLAARDLRVKGVPLTGFGDAVTGKKPGDRVTFEAPVPEDHESIDIRGKVARFEFTIREIKRLHLPNINEAFLATLGFESEGELRTTVRSSLESRLDASINEAMQGQIGQHLIDHTKLEIPEGLSQRQMDRSVTRRMIEMYRAGVPQADIEKKVDELRSQAHDQVVRDLKLFFILEKIAEDRDITVSEETINGAIAQIAQRSNKRFDRVRDELSKGDGLTVLYHQLRDQRVLDALLKDAEITDTAGPKKRKSATKASGKPSPKKTASRKTTKTKTGKRSS